VQNQLADNADRSATMLGENNARWRTLGHGVSKINPIAQQSWHLPCCFRPPAIHRMTRWLQTLYAKARAWRWIVAMRLLPVNTFFYGRARESTAHHQSGSNLQASV